MRAPAVAVNVAALRCILIADASSGGCSDCKKPMNPIAVRRRGPARVLRTFIGLALLLAACHPTRGCAESEFELAPEARLPRWFAIPPGMSRSDLTVTLTYYFPLVGSGRSATVTLRTRQGKTLSTIVATLRGMEPQTTEPYSGTGRIPYPSYEVITANGMTEIIEHRRMEPLFYINDDADVRRKLAV